MPVSVRIPSRHNATLDDLIRRAVEDHGAITQIAWARHPTGPADSPGVVSSVCVIPGADEDEIWIAVLRTVNGSTARYIERFTSRMFDTQDDCFFVDCGVSYDFEAPTDTLTELDHLEGETVAILADGAVYPAQTVSGGQVVLSQAVSKAAAGLGFQYVLEPMRIDTQSRAGSSRGSLAKIPELVLSFLKTGGAKYGASTAALFEIDWRTTEVYDSPPELFTGDKLVTLDGGFDPENPIVISGEDPLPCTVRAIVARLDVTGR